MSELRVATCGDCIHADVCEKNPSLSGFSRNNPAHCHDFRNKADYEKVVRCKGCEHRFYNEDRMDYCCDKWGDGFDGVTDGEFCSRGERRNHES